MSDSRPQEPIHAKSASTESFRLERELSRLQEELTEDAKALLPS